MTEEQRPDTLSRAVWYKGFHTSIQLVDLFAASALPGDTAFNGHQDAITIYYPKNYFYVLVTAGMYFINLLAIDGDISADNRVLAQNYLSRESRDEMSRAAAVIELLSLHVDTQYHSKLCDSSNSVPPVSVIANGMKMVHELRNNMRKPRARIGSNVASPQVSDWPDFSDGFA